MMSTEKRKKTDKVKTVAEILREAVGTNSFTDSTKKEVEKKESNTKSMMLYKMSDYTEVGKTNLYFRFRIRDGVINFDYSLFNKIHSGEHFVSFSVGNPLYTMSLTEVYDLIYNKSKYEIAKSIKIHINDEIRFETINIFIDYLIANRNSILEHIR